MRPAQVRFIDGHQCTVARGVVLRDTASVTTREALPHEHVKVEIRAGRPYITGPE